MFTEEYNVDKLDEQIFLEIANVNTEVEFLAYIENLLLESKKINLLSEARMEIRDYLISNSKFYINIDEATEFSMQYVYSYESIAFAFGVTLEEYYVKKLGMSSNDFYQMCYDEGENQIKWYLIVGAIAYEKGMTVDDERINFLEEEELSYE